MFLRTLGVAFALAAFSASAQAPLDVRLALVIGNGAYAGAPLPNPANDAKAMGETLRGLGFGVIELQDASKAQMSEAIAKMGEALKGKQAVGMLYYAGHGLQVDWRNFMVPVEARMGSAADVPTQAVDVTSVIDAFKAAGTRMSILVLDACRDNPFGSIASGKGLAQLDAPPGTFLAYATAPGNVAEDGDVKTGNGLYTQFLLQELKKPTARIEDVFKRVRLSVRKQSQGRQIPWESTSLEEDFVFNDGTRLGTRPADLERLAQEARLRERELLQRATQAREQEARVARDLEQERQMLAQAQRLAEAEARQKAEAESRERERQLLLAQRQEQERAANATRVLADARRAEEERLKAVELAKSQAQAAAQTKPPAEPDRAQKLRIQNAEWERIKTSKNVDDFYAYLQKYPSGYIAEHAQFRLDQLQKDRIQVVVSPNSVKPLASGEPRYRLGDDAEFDVIDGFTKVARRTRSRVTYADSERVEFNNGALVRDQMGGIIRNQFGEKRPALINAPADLNVGKKWRTAFTNTTPNGVVETNFWDYKVTALETIEVPAGRYQAFRIEGRGEARFPDGFTTLTSTTWINPATMIGVRHDILFRDRRGNIVNYDSTQLVSFKRGGS